MALTPKISNPALNKLGIAAAAGAIGYGIFKYWKNRNTGIENMEIDMPGNIPNLNDGPFPFGEMSSCGGEQIALKSVGISGRIDGLFFGWTIRQEYRNETTSPLEIIYTFPLGYNAALLGMDATIGEKRLTGTVVENMEAEEKYEKAVSDGDSAIMVQQSARGLYTANLGNIAAGESVVVELHCARLLNFEQGMVRLCIPTVVGERYGNPYGPGGLAAHESVKVDTLAKYPFSLELVLAGDVAKGEIECPGHKATITKNGAEATVKLDPGAALDRDFILLMKGIETASHALCVPDGEEYMLAASFQPAMPSREISPIGLKILVDCSGSMSGSSIGEARKGLGQILQQLTPRDYISYSRFGSNVIHSSKELRPCTPEEITRFSGAIDKTRADMGGTEMEGALKSTFDIGNPAGDELAPMVLLITDGDVWNTQNIIAEAKKSGHRIFVVGVGFAPGEHVVRDMANATGGACELVSPNENIAGVIVRMFNRMRGTIASKIRIDWPEEPVWQSALPKYIYDGETVHAFALMAKRPQGQAVLRWQADGHECEANSGQMEYSENGGLVRLGRMREIEGSKNKAERIGLALKYQLVSENTSLILVHEREEKIDKPLKIQQVPQMAAHGHGSFGGIGAVASFCCAPTFMTGGTLGMSVVDSLLRGLGSAPDADGYVEDGEAEAEEILVKTKEIYPVWKSNLYSDGTMAGFIKAVEADAAFAGIVEAVHEIACKLGIDEEAVWAEIMRNVEIYMAVNYDHNKERHSTRLINATLKNISPADQALLDESVADKFTVA